METDNITFEVISGPEGPCLAMWTPDAPSSTRIAGPKPWGGGRVLHAFRVKRSELLKELGVEEPT